MHQYPADIYKEPEPDTDTLANLGPLCSMAGVWSGTTGEDVNPKADGPEHQQFIERYELQPIDAQTNGPQLFYGLRYHTRIVKPDDPETFHDQVGYWLWEPATGAILLTLSIPRGQIAMAVGHATPDAKSFTLEAVRGSLTNGIISNPFLEQAFRTDRYTIKVDIHADGTWSYEQDTLLVIPGQVALIPLLRAFSGLQINGTFLALWLVHTGFGLSLAIYLLYNYISGLPREILESAFIDGASQFTIFLRLILPLSVPALASFAIFQFLWVWNDYLNALIFLGTSPDQQVVTIKLAQMLGSRGQDWHLLTAGGFVSMILPLVVFFSLQRFFVRGMLAGSVKG